MNHPAQIYKAMVRDQIASKARLLVSRHDFDMLYNGQNDNTGLVIS